LNNSTPVISPDEIYRAFPGPILLLAGPGTGKTYNIAKRIKWLIEEKKISPEEITVITFTLEATANMRQRLSDEEKEDVYLEPSKHPTISTIHSLGYQIISEDPSISGAPEDFMILESDELRKILFRDAAQLVGLKRTNGDEAAEKKQRAISITPKDKLNPVFQKYNEILSACGYVDYDDLILKAIKVLSENPDILSKYHKRSRHLLVDEYQDINKYQFDFINILSGDKSEGLFAVGDDDQSIYSFRGGTPLYIREFKNHFGEKAKLYYLHHCQRCPEPVLRSAITIVEKYNKQRVSKPKPTFKSKIQTPIQIYDFPSQEIEAKVIAKKCKKIAISHDVLILVPNKNYFKPLTTELRKQKIGYSCKVIFEEEGISFLDDIGNWLADPSLSFLLRQGIQFLLDNGRFGVPSKKVRLLEKLEEREKYLGEISALWLRVLIDKTTLYNSLCSNKTQSTFISQLEQYFNKLISVYNNPPNNLWNEIGSEMLPWKKPKEMFQEIAALKEVTSSVGGNVRIMTMRKAKGLDADYVFIVGLDESLFPKGNSPIEEIEEMSRLLFVSMTRAKIELHLCHARKRGSDITYKEESFALKKSSFLVDIPKEYCKENYFLPISKLRKRMDKK
jgi:superfamily I DNA/RNA helicase